MSEENDVHIFIIYLLTKHWHLIHLRNDIIIDTKLRLSFLFFQFCIFEKYVKKNYITAPQTIYIFSISTECLISESQQLIVLFKILRLFTIECQCANITAVKKSDCQMVRTLLNWSECEKARTQFGFDSFCVVHILIVQTEHWKICR